MTLKLFYTVAIASLVWLSLSMLANSQGSPLVSEVCFRCICEATSGCNATQACTHDVCGIFRITWGYWFDGGQLTLNGELPESPSAFENCVNDPICAANTIQNYMVKFGRDCNGDNQVDCYDYAAIHKFGGNGCSDGLYGSYGVKFNQCMQAFREYGK